MSAPTDEVAPSSPRRERRPSLYRGHRRDSFMPLDKVELVELRARQRTFEGAWQRTALVNLGYGAVVLKVFDRRFFSIGILYTAIGLLLIFISLHRRKDSNHAFSDAFPNRWDGPDPTPTTTAPPPADPTDSEMPPRTPPSNPIISSSPTILAQSPAPISPTSTPADAANVPPPPHLSLPAGPPAVTAAPASPARLRPKETSSGPSASKDVSAGPRVYGAPFVTAGGVVLLFGAVVGLMEIALFVLVMRI